MTYNPLQFFWILTYEYVIMKIRRLQKLKFSFVSVPDPRQVLIRIQNMTLIHIRNPTQIRIWQTVQI
jgi:hypothetical protein